MMEQKYSVYLRGFEESDALQINKWRNDRKIQALVSAPFRYVPLAIEKEWVRSKMLENRRDIYLAVCLKENDRMIGYISINNIDHLNRTAFGGGVVLDPEYQDGFVRHEVGILIRELAFDHLNINRFEGRCLAEHETSRILMEACGYKLEGVLRDAVYKDGSYHDQCVYSLLRDDYYKMMEKEEYSLKDFAKRVKNIRKQRRDGKI